MQPTVSIVVPCYNKVQWIGEMLQSIMVQQWDNVQVILVNDGSTDGTRDVIAEWEPKLKHRGYRVIIIDQENQGVTAAVRNGLLRVSGDFVCQIDCDDQLACDYLAIMAGFLVDHPEYDGVSCAFELGEYSPNKNIACDYTAECVNRLKNYIVMRMELSACVYMVRTSYLQKHHIIEHYKNFPRLSQEPPLVIQLLGNDGKFKYIPKGLYLRNLTASDKTRMDSPDKTITLMGEYYDAMAYYIQFLRKTPEEITELKLLTAYGRLKTFLTWTQRFPEADRYRQNWINAVLALLKNEFAFPFSVSEGDVRPETFKFFFAFADAWVLSVPFFIESPTTFKRIIGYGVLGMNAKNCLPFLKNTALTPSILWDKAVSATPCPDSAVKKPDFQSLTEDDLLLVFPSGRDIKEAVQDLLKRHGKNTKCLYSNQINEYIGRNLFQK